MNCGVVQVISLLTSFNDSSQKHRGTIKTPWYVPNLTLYTEFCVPYVKGIIKVKLTNTMKSYSIQTS